jgi:hypothetical protein
VGQVDERPPDDEYEDEEAEPANPPVRDSEAEYALEYAAVCPHCVHTLHTVKVIRLLRTRVNFTSTLPRRGRVIICPNCRKILTAELTQFA